MADQFAHSPQAAPPREPQAEAPAAERDGAGVQGHGAGEEKRRFPRAAVELSVEVRFGSVQEFLNATAEDLSVGGMFLRSQHFGDPGVEHSMGSLVALQFDAGSRRVVQGIGRVVRVIRPGVAGVAPGVGVEFVELDEASRKLVSAIVEIKLAQTFGG